MTFALNEASKADGRPRELYTFRRGGNIWRYTSAADPVTIDGTVWEAALVHRGPADWTSEMNRSNLRVTVARDLAAIQDFRVSPPTEVMTLALEKHHIGDADKGVIYLGRVLSVEWVGSEAIIVIEPVYTSLRRIGLRRLYQRLCPHVLYRAQCGVLQSNFDTMGTVTSVAGNVVAVPAADALADGFFSGGIIGYTVDGRLEQRMIVAHVGQNLTLSVAPVGLAAGMAVHIYPGCDHTLTTCQTKFANHLRYGGFPFIPLKNPFGGTQIY